MMSCGNVCAVRVSIKKKSSHLGENWLRYIEFALQEGVSQMLSVFTTVWKTASKLLCDKLYCQQDKVILFRLPNQNIKVAGREKWLQAIRRELYPKEEWEIVGPQSQHESAVSKFVNDEANKSICGRLLNFLNEPK